MVKSDSTGHCLCFAKANMKNRPLTKHDTISPLIPEIQQRGKPESFTASHPREDMDD